MLHIVTLSHGPDTCAAAHPEMGELARSAWAQLAEASKNLDVNVQGSWADMPGHVIYMLADAPNAHAVSRLTQELKLFHWNTVNIHPVISMDDAISQAAG